MDNCAASLPSRASLILMIDDTPANCAVIVARLEDQGYRVAVAQDGEEGIERANLIIPDLILLDVVMPGIDGFETCRRLKKSSRTCAIPVIFMTALAEVQDKLTGFAVGGVDYVIKPFQIEEVLARVGTHLALRAAQQRLAEQNIRLAQEVAMRWRADAALRHANEVLEERVAKRTAELSEANVIMEAEITERKQAEKHIRYLAHHDSLTGLPNRLLLEDRLNQAIAQARRHPDQMVGVLFIDLDYFKPINDSLGHQIGDLLLREVALRLQGCMREGDSVARVGGDEFVISLPALAASGEAALVAGKALAALEGMFNIEGHELHISGSIGISLYPGDGADVQSLMRAADAAMYHAKENGRGNFQFFTAALNETAHRRLTVANQLRHALARGEFLVYYQPQLEMESGRIISAEALLRLSLPGTAPVSCGEFISIAEETGLILPIGEWVLRQACAELQRWRQAGHAQMRIAVNLSARQFFQSGLAHVVAGVLEECQLPADALDLEITESMLMQPSRDNMSILRQLSMMGVQLSIDDFGTGYSNLSYLRQFPIHALKIDRSFIVRISHDPHDDAIVSAIISMANSLGLKVIAEGVDGAGQASFLRAHGCFAAQGFLYSEPVSAQAFSELLAGPCGSTPPAGNGSAGRHQDGRAVQPVK